MRSLVFSVLRQTLQNSKAVATSGPWPWLVTRTPKFAHTNTERLEGNAGSPFLPAGDPVVLDELHVCSPVAFANEGGLTPVEAVGRGYRAALHLAVLPSTVIWTDVCQGWRI